VITVLLVKTALRVRFNVAIESHPTAVLNVSLYDPAVVSERPFHVYGNWLLQIVTVEVLERTALMIRSKVASESQPDELVKVSV
jgi:uncharacterized membrane protein